MRILVIIPYFGSWPEWMAYYLQSCAYNPSIHWLLYSDCGEPAYLPDNVRYEYADLSGFNRLASSKLKLEIDCYHPYKICDLRPAFGQIFSDFLQGYDFWGYADLDIVFGNITSFITGDLLAENDVISVRKDYFSGHFALYKNTPATNMLYARSDKYKHIFLDASHHYAYDERSNFTGRKLPGTGKPSGGKWLSDLFFTLTSRIRYRLDPAIRGTEYPDMTTILQKTEASGEIKWHHEDLVRSDLWYMKQKIRNWEIVWKNGILSENINGKELLHFHFLNSKRNRRFRIETWQAQKGFRIHPAGISPIEDKGQSPNR